MSKHKRQKQKRLVMKGGKPMLDDLRQDKQEQPLDPLAEGSSLPWSKKVALLCLAVALIGLFIFFTSDSWSSEGKHSKHAKKQELAQEIEAIKTRLTDLEMRLQTSGTPVVANGTVVAPAGMTGPEGSATASINLQALIDQELQESHKEIAAKDSDANGVQDEEPVAAPVKKKAQVPAKKQQTYTVQKGDSLSKISHKFFGSTKYWKRIVEANKDKLGSSQTLRPGMTLVIPSKEETK